MSRNSAATSPSGCRRLAHQGGLISNWTKLLSMGRVAIFNDTSVSGHIGCRLVMVKLIEVLLQAGFTTVFVWPAWKSWDESRMALDSLSLDLVVINGEGTIHHDNNPDRVYVAKLLSLIPYCRDFLGIPVAVVNASISTLSTQGLNLLAQADVLMTRDSASTDYLASSGIYAKTLCDLSLLSEPLNRASREKISSLWIPSTNIRRSNWQSISATEGASW